MPELSAIQEASNRAVAMRQSGNLHEALDSFVGLTQSSPEIAETWHNLGMVYDDLGHFAGGLICYQRAYRLKPSRDTSLAVAQSLLRFGRWNEAWPYWENGRYRNTWQECAIPVWAGEPLEGKRLLVVREGGFGDTFLFLRFLKHPLVSGAEITLIVWDEMLSLLAGWGGISVKGNRAEIRFADYDYMVPLLSLPTLCEATPENVGVKGPYISVRARHCYQLDYDRPNVGLCWKAGEVANVRSIRSIPVEELAPLASVGVNWIALCPDSEAPSWCRRPELKDWKRTAEVINALDLVVSADTAVAHLAAAMGKPVITILPLNSDWKWGLSRTDTVWYPSMRLIRNTDPQSFKGAIEQVVNEWPS